MQILLNTDNRLSGSEPLAAQVEDEVRARIDRFSDRVTRVEVHLGDHNGAKAGAADKRCLLEARLAGLQPISASDRADTIDLAVRGAIDKLKRALDHTLGRLDSR